ncbi:hypothetical protein MA5S0422_1129 [Mycobacteroides abscessus 5S-0422]|nr:hypothetical protein MA5S0422_3697 [Mycobacteroides abscessus 5S-0422]EIU07271.1 hypothetical protein MA5S0421_2774 [Mycobacteroides abscessus 5S-0421]EIU21937.1 hypothetical protein MA5S0708_2449 [Mycobacteroides abscessus 5S-0708]EIU24794.1 hypothetical protein MA5S0817_2067 [Mycobacteroides abscessus 5S-0817]EIU29527.1 hypothetical protein MA5S1212_2203 [Mycobacteroides abscessus 5S-1212]EIU41769.1 hypothetical protein MA5S1215_2558 [Mycobacteroides abscessus 5S-1215]EIU90418.1 hypothet
METRAYPNTQPVPVAGSTEGVTVAGAVVFVDMPKVSHKSQNYVNTRQQF